MKRLAFAACMFLTACTSNTSTILIDRWYAALSTVNRAEFAELLADNATLTFDDLSVTQTKAEFIESLDEWEGANKNATIRHSIGQERGTVTTVLVCYKFPGNELLTQEDFAVEGNKIISSKQKNIADSCANFPK